MLYPEDLLPGASPAGSPQRSFPETTTLCWLSDPSTSTSSQRPSRKRTWGPSSAQKAEGPKSYHSFTHSLTHSISKYLFEHSLGAHQGWGQVPSLPLGVFSPPGKDKKKKKRKEKKQFNKEDYFRQSRSWNRIKQGFARRVSFGWQVREGSSGDIMEWRPK